MSGDKEETYSFAAGTPVKMSVSICSTNSSARATLFRNYPPKQRLGFHPCLAAGKSGVEARADLKRSTLYRAVYLGLRLSLPQTFFGSPTRTVPISAHAILTVVSELSEEGSLVDTGRVAAVDWYNQPSSVSQDCIAMYLLLRNLAFATLIP